jgi:hypothetical protein
MDSMTTLDEVLVLAGKLSPVDKVRLIEQIAPQIERELQTARNTPRKSLRGIWQGLNISADELTQLRKEMWRDFPRNVQ